MSLSENKRDKSQTRRNSSFYLAQAGFCIKSAGNKIIVIDAYLSDAAERLFGFKE